MTLKHIVAAANSDHQCLNLADQIRAWERATECPDPDSARALIAAMRRDLCRSLLRDFHEEKATVDPLRSGHPRRAAILAYARNGRWGTCVECPRDGNGEEYPEACRFAERSDHLLSVDDLARLVLRDEMQRLGLRP